MTMSVWVVNSISNYIADLVGIVKIHGDDKERIRHLTPLMHF